MLIDLLLAAHIIGLMMGAGGGFGSMISQREALKRPADQAATLRSIGPALATFSFIGLILMWITGLALVFLKHGGFGALPQMFWIKFIFISTLTLAAIATQVLFGQVKAGNTIAATRVPAFGQIAGISSILAVVFATLAFH
jgi:hypothetical protein